MIPKLASGFEPNLRGLAEVIILATGLLVSCRLPGPVLHRANPERRIDLPGVGTGVGQSVWRFKPGNGDWADLRAAELLLYRRSHFRGQSGFELRLVGRNADRALRLKVWTGTVDRHGDVLDLHAERCAISGKRDFTDRLVPLEAWTCDHLAMHFRVTPSGLIRIRDRQDARTAATDWFYADHLEALYASSQGFPTITGSTKPFVWMGQQLVGPGDSEPAARDLPYQAPDAQYGPVKHPGGLLGERDGAVYFGADARYHLRPGDRLSVFSEDGKQMGEVAVLHVVDDFVLVQQAIPHAPLAGTVVSHKPQGLFQ